MTDVLVTLEDNTIPNKTGSEGTVSERVGEMPGLKSQLVCQIYIYIQGVPGGMCQTSGGCSLC